MSLESILLIVLAVLLIVAVIVIFMLRRSIEQNNTLNRELIKERFDSFEKGQNAFSESITTRQSQMVQAVNDNRQGTVAALEQMRKSTSETLEQSRKSMSENLEGMRKTMSESIEGIRKSTSENLDGMRKTMSENLDGIRTNVGEKLETIRATVDEKLEKTLSDRLGKSFETVGKQLIEVQKGLGEMQSLAQDVGGLKKVLANVKMRGGLGEVQLSMLLEQILAPEQYQANVHIKPRSAQVVEFAVRLPGKDEDMSQVWLPIDAKFPRESYEKLQIAYEAGNTEAIENERNAMYRDIKRMAADIRDKYIAPPYSTDFAIMFLPFEGIYGEVVRSAGLIQELQNQYKVIVTGPTTLAALLNSLQMGFRTLAIQKRSSEVWKVLSGVKKEFETFGDLLEKAKKNIQGGLNNLDELSGVRTRQIQNKLKDVEAASPALPPETLPRETN